MATPGIPGTNGMQLGRSAVLTHRVLGKEGETTDPAAAAAGVGATPDSLQSMSSSEGASITVSKLVSSAWGSLSSVFGKISTFFADEDDKDSDAESTVVHSDEAVAGIEAGADSFALGGVSGSDNPASSPTKLEEAQEGGVEFEHEQEESGSPIKRPALGDGADFFGLPSGILEAPTPFNTANLDDAGSQEDSAKPSGGLGGSAAVATGKPGDGGGSDSDTGDFVD